MRQVANYALSRRTLLRATSAVALLYATGCSVGQAEPEPTPPADPLQAILDDHLALRWQYRDTIDAFPEVSARLNPLLANLDAQVAALAGALALEPPDTSTPPTPSASSGSAASGTPDPGAANPTQALASLAAAEEAAVADLHPLLLATTRQRAPLVGSLIAAHTCHRELL